MFSTASAILVFIASALVITGTTGFSATSIVQDAAGGAGLPPCYVIIEAKLKHSELSRFGEYASKVPAVVSQYGGEYIVLGGNQFRLEGDWGETRIVMHKWPTTTMAKAFWNSKEYQEVKKLREGTGEFRIMLAEGLNEDDFSK